MIELEQLKQLIAFATYGTLSKAAEKLYISQPALSRSIQKLEKTLGVELFDRKKNKMELNQNGKTVIQYAEKILNLVDEMEEKVNKNNQVLNNFSIGSCAPAPLWDMISLFGRFYPEKYILHKIENNLQLFEKLKNGSYQMIILSEPIDNSEFFCIKYKTEQLFLSVPLQHPLAKKKEIHFSDITDDRMLLFNPIGIWKDVVLEKMPNMNFLIQNDRIIYQELAEMQNLLHFRSNFTLEREDNFKNNISIPIADKEAKMTFYCVCKKNIKNEIEKLFDSFSKNF